MDCRKEKAIGCEEVIGRVEFEAGDQGSKKTQLQIVSQDRYWTCHMLLRLTNQTKGRFLYAARRSKIVRTTVVEEAIMARDEACEYLNDHKPS